MTYPYAKEFITDAKGHIVKVVLEWEEYQNLIEALEDDGLLRAMKEANDEIPLSLDQALRELEEYR